jgi:hypothetical protein
MPRIVVETEGPQERETLRMLTERVLPSDLESGHFAAQLLERLSWAVDDARRAERDSVPA